MSPGRISVAIWPGGTIAAATAFAPSAPTSPAVVEVCTQCDIGQAMPSMSAVSGASSAICAVACSPTMLTMPDPAFLALCRLASPFASPGPRCSSVEAGRPAMR